MNIYNSIAELLSDIIIESIIEDCESVTIFDWVDNGIGYRQVNAVYKPVIDWLNVKWQVGFTK